MGTKARRVVIGAALAVAVGIVAALLIVRPRHAGLTLTGVVLRQDSDPRKQLPIPNVKITATEGERSATGESDTSGLFRLKLQNGSWREQPVSITFRHPGYQAIEITPTSVEPKGQLQIVRMSAVPAPAASAPGVAHAMTVKDVRVRYSEKSSSTVNVGSTAKTFTVPNVGDVPCEGHPPCSPDGKWKAANGAVTIDAGQGQQFQNARVSCIAGPCPFTKIESGAVPAAGRTITVNVINWSDTATFLVEAEVTRTTPSDAIRQAYPAIYGNSMSFTLPATAEGPSIEADLDGSVIVFPLGPALQLSWAECTLQVGAVGEIDDLLASLRSVEDMFVEWRRMARKGLKRPGSCAAAVGAHQDLPRLFRLGDPGVVQTPAYTRAILRAIATRRGLPDDTDEAADVRADRLRLRRGRPPVLRRDRGIAPADGDRRRGCHGRAARSSDHRRLAALGLARRYPDGTGARRHLAG